MQTSDAVKRQEIRQMSKKNAEHAGGYAKQLLSEVLEFEEETKPATNLRIDRMVRDLVFETSQELSGTDNSGIKWLEKSMKKSVQVN